MTTITQKETPGSPDLNEHLTSPYTAKDAHSAKEPLSGIICLSGGLDSTTLLYSLLKEGHILRAISFSYGSKHNEQELAAASYFCKRTETEQTIIDLSFLNHLLSSSLLLSGTDIPEGRYSEVNMKSTVVPFRNGIFLSFAVSLADSLGLNHVFLASHAGDRAVYPDCTAEFNDAFSKAALMGTDSKVNLVFPFQSLSKTDIGNKAHNLDLPFERTYTCYKGNEKHCGLCAACLERKEALGFQLGKDRTSYER